MGVNTTRSFLSMNRYARTAPGQTLEIIPTRRPFSFFNFVETRFKEYQPLRRILSQVRMHDGKTMVIERLDNPADLNEENQDLRNGSGAGSCGRTMFSG